MGYRKVKFYIRKRDNAVEFVNGYEFDACMSATDKLRHLLDERGVAHSDHYLSTTWRDGHGILHLAGEPMADGSLVVDMLTPEQAVAATLNGRAERTCRVLEHDELPYAICSECGAIQPDDFTVYYCWLCGARVVGE